MTGPAPRDVSDRDRDQWIRGGGGPPGIDPTVMTQRAVDASAAQLRREVMDLKELLSGRLDSIDEATSLRLKMFERVPSEIREEVGHLRELMSGRMDAMDIRATQAAIASKEALTVALLAAKELVGQQNTANAESAAKAELSAIKQADQIVVLVGTIQQAFAAQITEMKERLDRSEGSRNGGRDVQGDNRAITQLALTFIFAILAIASLGVTIYSVAHK